jgi:hypothetical protein
MKLFRQTAQSLINATVLMGLLIFTTTGEAKSRCQNSLRVPIGVGRAYGKLLKVIHTSPAFEDATAVIVSGVRVNFTAGNLPQPESELALIVFYGRRGDLRQPAEKRMISARALKEISDLTEFPVNLRWPQRITFDEALFTPSSLLYSVALPYVGGQPRNISISKEAIILLRDGPLAEQRFQKLKELGFSNIDILFNPVD